MAPPQGYEKIAVLMSRRHELGIVRSFGELNFRNLLYLQAELVQLESELRQITEADMLSNDTVRQCYSRHWPLLSDSQNIGNAEQVKKVLEIRIKLREYNACLRDQRALAQFNRPRQYCLQFLRSWMVRTNMGNRPIVSNDRNAWDPGNEHDLIVLAEDSSMDTFSTWINENVIPLYHNVVGKHHVDTVSWDSQSGVTAYSDVAVRRAIDALATIVSSLFPIMATIALYFVQSMPARLGLIAAFTAVFSCCLALLTSAKRVEVFAATTAFAAVQVVFIGANSNGPAQLTK